MIGRGTEYGFHLSSNHESLHQGFRLKDLLESLSPYSLNGEKAARCPDPLWEKLVKIDLTLYNIKDSATGKLVSCDQEFCYAINGGPLAGCTANMSYSCGATQLGNLDSSNEEALDGILGFGKSNTSMISQLASSGQVKRMFAHCLDGINGGGIFAIGHVMQPKVNMTPLVPNQCVTMNIIIACSLSSLFQLLLALILFLLIWFI
ncbi:hypothetical protein Goshw_027605 [Gossypium schwendimanii]|uniref:Xylanase inhibitor N-terminal domain-containing protein n=1 Tax=Gossypium schwendimanii TaxID=34291 RepID=A0A7J9LCJ3_GOSSC|nr:hypothetical protein [Gossypium schwendimanii]